MYAAPSRGERPKRNPTSLSLSFTTSACPSPQSICSRAPSRLFQSGGRRLGSKVMSFPRSFAKVTARCVAPRAGSSVRESVPKWNAFVFSMSERSNSSKRSCVSAPGLRAKEKERSPRASSVTNASVVKASSATTTPRVSTPTSRSVPVSIVPKASAPTLLKSAVLPPSRAMAARKLAGAPPGCAAMSG